MLSHIWTFNGLFLLKPMLINYLDKLQIPPELQAFEQRMRHFERIMLVTRGTKMAELE